MSAEVVAFRRRGGGYDTAAAEQTCRRAATAGLARARAALAEVRNRPPASVVAIDGAGVALARRALDARRLRKLDLAVVVALVAAGGAADAEVLAELVAEPVDVVADALDRLRSAGVVA